jgi:autotransporter translocation and assembly factor TamB
VSQLGESQQVALLDRAGDIALGALATSLADQLGRAFDVDLFEIRAPSSTGAGDVSVGTQVNERLFVGFRQEFGSAGASVLSIEYRLTEFLRLLTSVSHGGAGTTRERESTGADLVFRIRY